MQLFKSVYFADHPAPTASRRNLKIAFGPDDAEIFEAVAGLSSYELRQAMGTSSYLKLKTSAMAAGRTVNAFCLERLRQLENSAAQQMLLPEIQPRIFDIDPIQTTFRGGIEEPLHNWYPYLEGYSPDFVNSLLDAFAPTAVRILDPFAGSGTTPLAVAKRAGAGIYCELNPLLQFLIETKANTLVLREQPRQALVVQLANLALRIKTEVPRLEPDQRLQLAYQETFGGSAFFPPATFENVLKLRTWLDSINCSSPQAAAVATIAAVGSFIGCSNLIRRGDVRFRKGPGEEAGRNNDVLGLIANRLQEMSKTIASLHSVTHKPFLISGDAKRLGRVAYLGIDAVVTSPPYLNGTNYYRNTKLELWFIRALQSGKDLAGFRSQTITAGINDVTVDKLAEPINESVAKLVKRLNESSYDRRIPQMILSYFSDMEKVLKSVGQHMRPGAPMLMDIGDSAYAGIHVDTPDILKTMFIDRGWTNIQEISLRHRLSRSGQGLRQVVITAEAPKTRPLIARPLWKEQWNNFKKALPHQQGEFSKRNWGNPLHSLCSYQGKMKPSLAKHLVDAFLRPGQSVVDPFGGVGTIPFEAAMSGVNSWSFDISPAAVPIAMAKLQPATKAQCYEELGKLRAFISAARVRGSERGEAETIKFNGSLPSYFHPRTFDEILKARRYFNENPPIQAASSLVFSSLLHVLHGNRPYALSRRSHPITPFSPTGEAEYKSLIEKVQNKVNRALAVERSSTFVPGSVLFQDATAPWPLAIDNIDAVITSPPFFDSTRFYLANWMRLWFSGWKNEDFRERPLAFVDERQKKDFSVYKPIIRQARERLKPGGVCVFHLGKSRKCDMAVEIQKIASAWFSKSEIFSENIEHCESHGIRDKGAVVEHLYLVLY